jgi:hypothetical protein
VITALPFIRAAATPALFRWFWAPQSMAGAAVYDAYVLLEKKVDSAVK